jgi:UDP-glucose 4-epimerase
VVADREALTIGEIAAAIREGLGLPPRLFYVPVPMLHAAFTLLGRQTLRHALLGNLEVDSSGFCEVLGWSPRLTAKQALVKIGRMWVRSRTSGIENSSPGIA